MTLLFIALAIFAAGALAALAWSRSPRRASWAGSVAAAAGCAAALVFAVRALIEGSVLETDVHAWRVPSGAFIFGCDPISAFFLVPVCVLGALAAIYGREYLLAYEDRKLLGPPWAAYNLMMASLVVVTTARQGLLFLFAWELMTLSSYVLVTFEHEKPQVARAGWVYLIAAHIGTACLIGLFVLLERTTGTMAFGSAALTVGSRARALILLLGLVGFGVKAGVVGLHVWLPEAHAAAPSHVSAVMSGVLVKVGVYGLLRMSLLVGPAPAWWGGLLMVLGLTGGLMGIALATYQRDLKRVLAYSTVENVGIILLGLGLGFWGSATGHPAIAALGATGALLHVWNHTAMKGLLFLGAGAVVHATGTRDIERLGGLMRRLPTVGILFFVGAVAVSGLPPLNGFVGEWFVYRGMLDSATGLGAGAATVFMLGVGALSIVSALAALCFLRLGSIVFLGEPRSDATAHAHAPGRGMLAALVVLAGVCLAVGVRPQIVAGTAAAVAARIVSGASEVASTVAPLGWAAIALWLTVAIIAGLMFALPRSQRVETQATWGCGYAAPTPRMQYTGRGFAQFLAELMPPFLRARIEVTRPTGPFPTSGRLESESIDPIIRGVYEPALERTANRFARLRWLQQGIVHLYILYMLVALVAGLAWAAFYGELR